MVKTLKKLFLFIVIIIIAFYFSLDWIAKKGAEYISAEIAGVPIFLNEADLSLFSDNVNFKGIIIGNPQGFNSINACEIHNIKLDINFSTIFSNKIIINNMIIDSPHITYEKNNEKDSNIRIIFKNINSFAKQYKLDSPEDQIKKLQIYDFIVKNGKIDVKSKVLKDQTISTSMPDIHIKDIGRGKNEKTIPEVIEILVKTMDEKLLEAISGPIENLKRKGLKILDNLKGLINQL